MNKMSLHFRHLMMAFFVCLGVTVMMAASAMADAYQINVKVEGEGTAKAVNSEDVQILFISEGTKFTIDTSPAVDYALESVRVENDTTGEEVMMKIDAHLVPYYEMPASSVTVYVVFMPKLIQEIDISGFAEPVYGKKPNKASDLTKSNNCFYIDDYKWKGGSVGTLYDPETEFTFSRDDGNHYWCAVFTVEAKTGFEIDWTSTVFKINHDASLAPGTIFFADGKYTFYSANYWDISFNANGGSGTMEPLLVRNNYTYSLPDNGFTAPEGKEFDCWKVFGAEYKPGETVTFSNYAIIEAQWKDIELTVSFDANGGSGTMAPVKVTWGTDYTLPKCDYTAPEGKEFDRWDLGAAGGTCTVKENKTLKAVWKDKETEASTPSTEAPASTPETEAPAATPQDSSRPAEEVSPENPVTLNNVDGVITTIKNDKDIAGSSYSLLQAKAVKTTKNTVKLSWVKVPGAKKYIIYGNKCGKKNRYVKIKAVKKLTYTQKKLKAGKYYKYIVVAVNGDKVLATSKTIHAATTGGKVGNNASVIPDKRSVSMKVGKSKKVTAKLTTTGKKVKNHRAVAYESSDVRIATVDKSGNITGVKAGTCYVFIYAQNGVSASVKVTVRSN